MARNSHRRCSVKNVVLKKFANWQENTCNFIKSEDSNTSIFLWILWNVSEHLFYRPFSKPFLLYGMWFKFLMNLKLFWFVSVFIVVTCCSSILLLKIYKLKELSKCRHLFSIFFFDILSFRFSSHTPPTKTSSFDISSSTQPQGPKLVPSLNFNLSFLNYL